MMMLVFIGDDYNDDDGDSNEDGDDDDRSPRYDVLWYAIRPRTLQRRHMMKAMNVIMVMMMAMMT